MTKTLKKKDLKALTRFNDQWCRLQKIGSKRPSLVDYGQYEDGDFKLHTYEETESLPEMYGAFVQGMGMNNWLRTSPIVDQDDVSTTFETVGGIYKVTKRG